MSSGLSLMLPALAVLLWLCWIGGLLLYYPNWRHPTAEGLNAVFKSWTKRLPVEGIRWLQKERRNLFVSEILGKVVQLYWFVSVALIGIIASEDVFSKGLEPFVLLFGVGISAILLCGMLAHWIISLHGMLPPESASSPSDRYDSYNFRGPSQDRESGQVDIGRQGAPVRSQSSGALGVPSNEGSAAMSNDPSRYEELCEIVKRGEEIYNERLKADLESTCWGKYIEIDVDSGSYVIGDSDIEVFKKFGSKFPNARSWSTRIGVPFRG